jgi:hypothetical protein
MRMLKRGFIIIGFDIIITESDLYLSQNPIKLEENNPNFYAYVHDSNVWIDPFGLSECGGGKRSKWIDDDGNIK